MGCTKSASPKIGCASSQAVMQVGQQTTQIHTVWVMNNALQIER